MAFSYIRADRDQLFLMPADMREWLPEGHLAWFVVDVVERLDTSELHKAHPNDGVGRAAYDPDMMLALLVYAYCTAVRSSRKIERLCSVDVAYRVVCANNLPDHSTIARFRQAHDAVAQRLFADALALCAAAGLARVGVVAVDGTRVGANASLRANRSRAEVEAEVAEMFAQAEAADAAEDRSCGGANGSELPPELADRQRRRARLDAALAELATEEPEAERDHSSATGPGRSGRAEQALAELEAELASPDSQLSRAQHQLELAEAAWREREQAVLVANGNRKGRPTSSGGGSRVAKARAKRDHKLAIAERRRRHILARLQKAKAVASRRASKAEEAKVNLTDPESRLMKAPRGWAQAYNAQAAVSQDGLVIASMVTKEHNDDRLCQPMMAATAANLAAAGAPEAVGTFLFDAGYLTIDNLVAPGPDRLIATKKSWQLRRAAKAQGYLQRQLSPGAGPIEAMEHRLRTKDGAELYSLRQHTVEPVFGHTKYNRGFARFMRRGQAAADAEWALINMTHNLLKLFSFLSSSPAGAA
ncbi:MAG TPA: transposase [Acidimicrobiales bacterium]|nr:transposase [Acidimicrobiales bacterium]